VNYRIVTTKSFMKERWQMNANGLASGDLPPQFETWFELYQWVKQEFDYQGLQLTKETQVFLMTDEGVPERIMNFGYIRQRWLDEIKSN